MWAGMRCVVSSMMAYAAYGLSRPANTATIDVWFNEEGVPYFVNHTSDSKVVSNRLRGSDGQCLNFLHIPKTGGTSVESVGVWGKRDQTLTCKGLGKHCATRSDWRCCEMKDGSLCSVWHVPPKEDEMVRKSYSSCETFCVVRHPTTRFRSEHTFQGGACTTEALKRAVDEKLPKLIQTPFANDCHFVPQVEYVNFGKDCQHVVQQENLEAAITDLVAKFGMTAHFSKEHKYGHDCKARFDEESLQKLDKFYHKDYDWFGYKAREY